MLAACSSVGVAQASAAPAVASAGASASASADLPARLLAAHNRYRAAVGVPPLRWDAALAADAASYAPQLAALGRLAHSSRGSRPGQRENLWAGPAGVYGPEAIVDNWASERARFRAGVFPHVSTTGDWMDVSHYSQIVWPTTTSVGCAIRRGGGRDWAVCRYSPPGNIDGRRVP